MSINVGREQERSIAFEEKKEEEKQVEFKPQMDKMNAVDPNQPMNKFV